MAYTLKDLVKKDF